MPFYGPSVADHGALTGRADDDHTATGLQGGTLSYVTLAAFGDGSDGDVTISGNTTLTRNMYYNNLTVDSTFTLDPGNCCIFVKGTCTINGAIAATGNAASGATGG